MQLSLLDYVPTPEESGTPITPKPFQQCPDPPFEVNVGDRLRLTKVYRDDLIGRVIVVHEVIRPCIVSAIVDGHLYTFSTLNAEKLEPKQCAINPNLLLWYKAKLSHRRGIMIRLLVAHQARVYSGENTEEKMAMTGHILSALDADCQEIFLKFVQGR